MICFCLSYRECGGGKKFCKGFFKWIRILFHCQINWLYLLLYAKAYKNITKGNHGVQFIPCYAAAVCISMYFGMWEKLVRVPDIVKGQAGLVNLTDVGKFV